MPCRALEAFRLTASAAELAARSTICLNALSGIGGVQTQNAVQVTEDGYSFVLMPCRALEAFRHTNRPTVRHLAGGFSLNALSGIGGVQTSPSCRGIWSLPIVS